MIDGAVQTAEMLLPCKALGETLAFFTDRLGFRVDSIFPADDPATAQISGYGLHLRLERSAQDDDSVLRLLCRRPDALGDGGRTLTAPNGTRIEIADADPPVSRPEARQSLTISRIGSGASWGTGRAGMQYRDLVPDRQGGHIIASHIRIPGSGPVPDYVHFHKVHFQMIYCARGWARLVYEDQGPPFLFRPGDCVLQPPEIRHRVLESGDDLEVVEVGSPAQHMTCVDHDLALPTDRVDPVRQFGGQRFIRHIAADAAWKPWREPGFTCRDTGIGAASNGAGSVQVIRSDGGAETDHRSHDRDSLLLFVLAGGMTLDLDGHHALTPGDSALIPAGPRYRLSGCTPGTEFIQVALPAF